MPFSNTSIADVSLCKGFVNGNVVGGKINEKVVCVVATVATVDIVVGVGTAATVENVVVISVVVVEIVGKGREEYDFAAKVLMKCAVDCSAPAVELVATPLSKRSISALKAASKTSIRLSWCSVLLLLLEVLLL